MRGDYRRRSTATWIIWGSAFTMLTLLMAWKFQWVGSDSNSPVVESESGGEDESALAQQSGGSNEDLAPLNPDVLNKQMEPGGRNPEDFQIPKRFGTNIPLTRSQRAVQPWEATPDRTNNPPGTRIQDSHVRSASATSNNVQPNYLRPENEPKTPLNYPPRKSPNVLPDRRNNHVIPAKGESPATPMDSGPSARLLAQIDLLIRRGETLEAHKLLSNIYWKKPAWRSAIRRRIEKTAHQIFFSPRPHFIRPHVVQPNEYLSTIARQYNVSYQYLERLNRVKASRIRAGQELKVLRGPFSAIVDLSDRELTIHFHGYYVARFRVGIGRDKRSPIGKHKVLNKVVKPQYTGQDPVTFRNYVVAGGDPKNPLGTHWIDIGNSFGIHGTNEPNSIGKAESQGCIRMHNDDIAWVYDFLQPGSEVIIQE
ncbi:MAG: hypothetical protein Tsb009_32400 [Planctomycetaceae bacterium]